MSIQAIDLTKVDWELSCFRPNIWMMRADANGPLQGMPDLTLQKVPVPGSPHTALLKAGLIKDWNVGTQSDDCEWIEHRHWEYATNLQPIDAGTPVTLECEGLDYSGWILVDTKIVTTFTGTLIRHRFDLSQALADGKPHRLSIVFADPPPEQGQVGFTSKSKYFKPRFSYSWDWCPHLVPVGIWDSLQLIIGEIAGDVVRVHCELADDHETGKLSIAVNTPKPASVRISLGKLQWDRQVSAGENTIDITVPHVDRWNSNGEGKANVYPLTVEIDGQKRLETSTGFKHIRWLPCDGAAPNNAPWICQINGKSIFLQGVNWSPVSPDYAAVTREHYAKLIDLYKNAGVNLFRVWGGSYLEKEDFYQLCDQAGILVWTEFPLSSSGIDNAAPADPKVIETLCDIATDYIRRRGHHACNLLWCGGNELFGEADKPGGKPNDLTHPAMAALAKVVEREDPGVRFTPASPSGPTFSFDPAAAGKHLHEDVHGPWNWGADLKSWDDLWQQDDSLFHSEFGFPAAEAMDILEQFRGDQPLWPVSRENPYWAHSAMWWIQADRFANELKGLPPEQAMPKLVDLSQTLQARMLGTAARLIKSRFPHCGGMLLWMGHDCFPCPSNTSIIDFLGRPKPAFHALAEIWKKNPQDL